jgi:hypothetical protein
LCKSVIIHSKKKTCILCLNLNTEPVKHKNAKLKHKSCVWLNLCVRILFVLKCCIFVLHYFLVHTYFMTVFFVCRFFLLFFQLAMIKYVLSQTNLLQQPDKIWKLEVSLKKANWTMFFKTWPHKLAICEKDALFDFLLMAIFGQNGKFYIKNTYFSLTYLVWSGSKRQFAKKKHSR